MDGKRDAMTGGGRFGKEEERKKREERRGLLESFSLDLARRLPRSAAGRCTKFRETPALYPARCNETSSAIAKERKNWRDTRDADGDRLVTGYLKMGFDDWNRIVKCYVHILSTFVLYKI